MESEKKNLTTRQKQIIKDVRNGFKIMASPSGIVIGNDNSQYDISKRLFFNLYEKGLIDQESKWPFDWLLTEDGQNIKL